MIPGASADLDLGAGKALTVDVLDTDPQISEIALDLGVAVEDLIDGTKKAVQVGVVAVAIRFELLDGGLRLGAGNLP